MHHFPQLIAFGICCLCCAVASAQDAKVLFWNGNPAAPHLDIVGDEGPGQLQPMRFVAARNGSFSAKVVVCSTAPLKGVSAKVSDLQARAGQPAIPASCMQVRYATGRLKSGWNVQPKAGSTFDVLSETAPDEVTPISKTDKDHAWVKTGRSYLPIWVTAAVPADAAPGEYSGRLTVNAGGTTKEIAISLMVYGYTLPDARDFQTWVETIQSPDTLALEYKVPLWSDQHWKLIEKSLRYGAMLGNKTVYFPLICESNFGNAESAVRWVTQGPGRYSYDFSVVEKYLDLQIKLQGKPRVA